MKYECDQLISKQVAGGAETLAQSANNEWMQEAIDGCADRDPTIPDRSSDYCRYCWALAAEIAALAGKRLDGRISELGCD